MDTIKVISGDFIAGTLLPGKGAGAGLALAMVERRGAAWSRHRQVYDLNDVESVKLDLMVRERRVGAAMLAVICLLPLGPLALLGLAVLALKRERAVFWCAFADGYAFLGELPAVRFWRLVDGWQQVQSARRELTSWFPVPRRGAVRLSGSNANMAARGGGLGKLALSAPRGRFAGAALLRAARVQPTAWTLLPATKVSAVKRAEPANDDETAPRTTEATRAATTDRARPHGEGRSTPAEPAEV